MENNKNLSEEDIQRQNEILQDLVNIAFHTGIVHAVNKAKSLNDPYILDAFHDLLADRLYDELIKRGKLKDM